MGNKCCSRDYMTDVAANNPRRPKQRKHGRHNKSETGIESKM